VAEFAGCVWFPRVNDTGLTWTMIRRIAHRRLSGGLVHQFRRPGPHRPVMNRLAVISGTVPERRRWPSTTGRQNDNPSPAPQPSRGLSRALRPQAVLVVGDA